METIMTKKEYDSVMARIETLINKTTEAGEADGLTKTEYNELGELSTRAADYEDNVLNIYPLSEPTLLVLNIEQKML
jgi:hypothetical protein